ncbi:MAG: flavodoxin-dependent (E)-4-hydroxy-3-methylbut-2-enyl-diphosphate synthase [Candidatus Marinimicrobia bacterium]|nr:flavodoxin-dependent (E)-4-hydroxy-3-methylbut-2-enyl-diphosphate synthase [Candidatus Neomarinimicrobiota bacterium]
MIKRRKTKKIQVGNIHIGGDAPVSIQSMINTAPDNVEKSIEQIHRLEAAGCELVRMAVPNSAAVNTFAEIKKRIFIPLVADIHFDYKLALASLDAGADKIRINPGNIGSEKRIKAVLSACTSYGIPIRIGVNGGSLEKDLLQKYGHPVPKALVKSAARHIRLCEEQDFKNIIVSIKASDVVTMISANRIFSQRFDYPLHLGVTEAGTEQSGSIRSSMGIGALLADGIGDTLRVSLSADPVKEIKVAKQILQTLNLRRDGVKVISCPTCGRCSYDVAAIANELESRVENIKKDVTVAVMGCVVNGPGEAREADLGIAGTGDGNVILFENGNKTNTLTLEGIVDRLINIIKSR